MGVFFDMIIVLSLASKPLATLLGTNITESLPYLTLLMVSGQECCSRKAVAYSYRSEYFEPPDRLPPSKAFVVSQ